MDALGTDLRWYATRCAYSDIFLENIGFRLDIKDTENEGSSQQFILGDVLMNPENLKKKYMKKVESGCMSAMHDE